MTPLLRNGAGLTTRSGEYVRPGAKQAARATTPWRTRRRELDESDSGPPREERSLSDGERTTAPNSSQFHFLLACRHNLSHPPCGGRHVIVRPESQYGPSGGSEPRVGIAIACRVRFDFRAPPSRIQLWPGPVLRTPMPKAPIDENRDSRAEECHIRAPTSARQCQVDAIAKAAGAQRRAQFEFARCVASAGDLHPPSDHGRRGFRPPRFRRRSPLRRQAAPRHLRPT